MLKRCKTSNKSLERHTPHCRRPGWLQRVGSQEGCPGKYQFSNSRSRTPDSGHNLLAFLGTTGWSNQPEDTKAWQSGFSSNATLATIKQLFVQQQCFCNAEWETACFLYASSMAVQPDYCWISCILLPALSASTFAPGHQTWPYTAPAHHAAAKLK